MTSGRTFTCVYKTATIVEGEQLPPLEFYRREVSPDGKTLTISVFETRAMDKPVSVEVFDRLQA